MYLVSYLNGGWHYHTLMADVDIVRAINEAHRLILAYVPSPDERFLDVIDKICSGPYALECAYALVNGETAYIWFTHACTHKIWPLVHWLMSMYGKANAYNIYWTFSEVCAYGHEPVARWLIDQFWLDDNDAGHMVRTVSSSRMFQLTRQVLNRYECYLREHDQLTKYKRCAFANACKYKCIWFIRWLDKTHGLTLDDVCAFQMQAFADACANGHWYLARWMAIRFELTRKHIRDADYAPLAGACEGGQLHIARWLVESFRLTARDVRGGSMSMLAGACGNGHLDVAQWLTDRFRLTVWDACSGHNYALELAIRRGHVVLLQWLVTRFGLGREGSRVNYRYMLATCTEKSSNALKWMLMALGPMRYIDTNWHQLIIQHASNEDTVEFAWWMVKRFGIMPRDIKPALDKYNHRSSRAAACACRWFDAFAAEW